MQIKNRAAVIIWRNNLQAIAVWEKVVRQGGAMQPGIKQRNVGYECRAFIVPVKNIAV